MLTRPSSFCISTALAIVLGWQAAVAQHPPDILRSDATRETLQYKFSEEDEQLLDDIQRGCFNYLWKEVDPESGLVKDRREVDVCSTAGAGFQLSALPIAVERGWITREQGEARALSVLKTLAARDDNRKFGVLLHFVDLKTGGPLGGDRSESASTVDHSLFLAGAIPAAEYFGGKVAGLVNKFIAETNWKAFDIAEGGFISMGWRAANGDLNGPGDFIRHNWHIASDEEFLVYFLAAGSPTPDYAGDPRDYYRLERTVKRHADMDPFVVSWNGSLFTYFFAHCWIDYRRFAADDPSLFGIDAPRVDWIENSRRATLTHRQRCIEAADRFKTLAEDRWGFAPCTGLNAQGEPTYLVQALKPNLMNEDVWNDGAVAPYAAGSCIMFTPAESMAALRAYRKLKAADGESLVWRDPTRGGYGFADSFNLDGPHVSDDNIAIDVGPMLLAIENARTGLIWRLFMQSETAMRAAAALKLQSVTK